VSILGRELSAVEANLGSVPHLEYAAGLLGVLNAALLEGKHKVSRAALIRLKARLDRLAGSIYSIQGLVETRIQAIRAELGDGC
jgi:hypothetical protein